MNVGFDGGREGKVRGAFRERKRLHTAGVLVDRGVESMLAKPGLWEKGSNAPSV